jgi:hypothetical protein
LSGKDIRRDWMGKTIKGWPTDSVRRVGHADVVAGVGVVNAVPHVRLQGHFRIPPGPYS